MEPVGKTKTEHRSFGLFFCGYNILYIFYGPARWHFTKDVQRPVQGFDRDLWPVFILGGDKNRIDPGIEKPSGNPRNSGRFPSGAYSACGHHLWRPG